MSPEFDLSRLASRYKNPQATSSQRIQDQINGQSNISETSHHHNKAEIARSKIFSFLSSGVFNEWMDGVEYDPLVGGDMYLYLNQSSPQGQSLEELIGYQAATVHVASNADRVHNFVKKGLKRERDRNNWLQSKTVVLDGSADLQTTTADLLLQMWLLSDNLFVPDLTTSYMSHFDTTSQLIMNTPDILRPVVIKRRPIIQALYPMNCTKNIYEDTHVVMEQFGLK